MWINDLTEYYKHSNVPEIRVTKLFQRFSGYDVDTLSSAVNMYLEDNEYFPTISSFKPYAETAEHLMTAKTIRRVHRHTDDEMYEWELARGTMRPLVDIEAEIAKARISLREMVT